MADPTTAPRVLVVGGGFGGLAVARALAGESVEVTVCDRLNYHLFQPLLYQVAMAGLAATDVAVPIRSILHAQNVEVLLGEVIAFDLDRRQAYLKYDYGARLITVHPPPHEVEEKERAGIAEAERRP